jgi:hypothetical protein
MVISVSEEHITSRFKTDLSLLNFNPEEEDDKF